MVVTLEGVNLVLDIVLKLLLLGLLVLAFFLLRRVDELVRSAERSAEEIGETSRKLGQLITVSRYIPFMGPKRDE